MKPSVILDIALLGHPQNIHRGPERVVRHLFEGLCASNQCDLSYVASTHLAGVYDFLKSRDQNPDQTLKFTPQRFLRSRIAQRLTKVVHGTMENRSLPARGSRYLLAKLISWCLASESSFPSQWLDHAQIYHTPLKPFSPVIKENKRIRKFITCLDFMPLRCPEYYRPSWLDFVKELAECLTPDTYAFCISESTRSDALSFSKIPPENVFVTPLAADPEIFHPVTDPAAQAAVRQKYHLGEEPYFLALSAHDRHKNFVHLIECFGRVVESGDLRDCNLVIVGPNPDRSPEVSAAISKSGSLAKKIRVTGYVPDEDLSAIYSASIAFLYPSIGEGFGIPPLEAMHCGVPVIASKTTSLPEVVGDAGILLPPTDKDEWCAAMLRMNSDAKSRMVFAQRSLTRAKLFSWQRFIDETLRGYRVSLERT